MRFTINKKVKCCCPFSSYYCPLSNDFFIQLIFIVETRLERKPWDKKHWHRRLSGNIIIDHRRVLQIWENYITELYDRANRSEHLEVEPEYEVYEDEKGPSILQSEVVKAIKEMRDKKATGDDDVPGDVLKLLGEDGLRVITQLMISIYVTGEWPRDLMEVTMIA
jgi:hypothetical protein